jgi:hypothetical protein
MCLFLVRMLTLFMALTAVWHGWKLIRRPIVVPAYRPSATTPPLILPSVVLPHSWANPAYQKRADQEEESQEE